MKKSLALTALTAAIAAGSSQMATAYQGSLSQSDILPTIAGTTVHQGTNGSLYSLTGGGTATPFNAGGGYSIGYHSRTAAGNLFNDTLTCTGDGLDASGNPIEGELDTHYGKFNIVYQGGNPLPLTLGVGLNPPVCNEVLGNTGVVQSGWRVANPVVVNGSTIVTVFLFDPPNRRLVTFTGASCPTDANIIPIAEEARDDLDAVLAAGGSLPGGALSAQNSLIPAGCLIFGVGTHYIGQCDGAHLVNECTPTTGKAVPVPAFAAGSLALGLAGVTYLTSRRRKQS